MLHHPLPPCDAATIGHVRPCPLHQGEAHVVQVRRDLGVRERPLFQHHPPRRCPGLSTDDGGVGQGRVRRIRSQCLGHLRLFLAGDHIQHVRLSAGGDGLLQALQQTLPGGGRFRLLGQIIDDCLRLGVERVFACIHPVKRYGGHRRCSGRVFGMHLVRQLARCGTALIRGEVFQCLQLGPALCGALADPCNSSRCVEPAAHGRSGDGPSSCRLAYPFRYGFPCSEIGRCLLLRGLRHLLQHALGERATGGRLHCSCLPCTLEPLRQYEVRVDHPELLRDFASGNANRTGSYPGGSGDEPLLASQVSGFLPYLLCGGASADCPLSCGGGNDRRGASGDQALCDSGPTQHGRSRLDGGVDDGRGVAEGGLDGGEKSLGLLHLLVRLLLLRGVESVERCLGGGRAKTYGIRSLSCQTTSDDVGHAHGGLGNADGTLHRRDRRVGHQPAQAGGSRLRGRSCAPFNVGRGVVTPLDVVRSFRHYLPPSMTCRAMWYASAKSHSASAGKLLADTYQLKSLCMCEGTLENIYAFMLLQIAGCVQCYNSCPA